MGVIHETDSLSCADGRHVHRLYGERNLGFDFGGFNLLLLAGECIAAVSTVVLAEGIVEWRSRTKGKRRQKIA